MYGLLTYGKSRVFYHENFKIRNDLEESVGNVEVAATGLWIGNEMIGYLVTGFGDAIAEPVGTRFGRHPYSAPSLSRVKAIRTWEGSAAVFLASTAIIFAGMPLLPAMDLRTYHLLMVPIIALSAGILEALSPHGWDNLTLQVVPSLLASVLL